MVVADDGSAAGWVDRHPGGPLPIGEGATEPDEPSALENLAMLLVESDLGCDRRPVLVVQLGRVELVAEDAEERDSGARVDGRVAAGLVFRAPCDVRPHRAQREGDRRPPRIARRSTASVSSLVQ